MPIFDKGTGVPIVGVPICGVTGYLTKSKRIGELTSTGFMYKHLEFVLFSLVVITSNFPD